MKNTKNRKRIKFKRIQKQFSVKSIILLVLIAPFFLIPLTGAIIKIGVLVGSFLPSWLIIMKVDINEIITLSNYIYYYTCFLAIEVTGILSYAVYKLSVEKELREVNEKRRQERINYSKELNKILQELKDNYNAYNKKRGDSQWTLSSKFETNKQFGYGSINNEFSVSTWKTLKTEVEYIFKETNNSSLFISIEYAFNIFELIKRHNDRNQFEIQNPTIFNETTKECIDELIKLIDNLKVF